MVHANRRQLMAAGLGASAASRPGAAKADSSSLRAGLEHYVSLGSKASGGPGDEAAGAWLQTRLDRLGFSTERRLIEAPAFEPEMASLSRGSWQAPIIPLAIVQPTGPEGVIAPIVVAPPWANGESLAGRIALVVLPHARWSSAAAGAVRQPIKSAIDAGAVAVALVTTGPTGEAIALNTDGREPLFDRPVASLAPRDAAPFLAPSPEPGRLLITGRRFRRPAFNLIARLDRGRSSWLVVSTPRSGWFTCGGERGPGVAAWLALAEWASRARLGVNLAFICTSGHEYENLGVAKLLEGGAPAPSQTALWAHLGANLAARDWHETAAGLTPLPSPDPQRFLVGSPELLEACRRAFLGQAGLERPYATNVGSAGELTQILASGYARVVGVFGAHRFHHVASDDLRCVDARLVAQAVEGFKRLIRAAVAQS
ncbi:hypothetical protein [Phenylobacterium sp.]|uniref:hypothetical protein n=1 Tax=Phenylobacterium sp. TaxID=1871053 RepID=UPI0035B398C6